MLSKINALHGAKRYFFNLFTPPLPISTQNKNSIKNRTVAIKMIFYFLVIWLLASCKSDDHKTTAAGKNYFTTHQLKQLVESIATHKALSEDWAKDISTSISKLGYDVTKENFCAVTAVIQQESSFKTIPGVSRIDKIIKSKLEKAGEKNWFIDKIIKLRLSQRHKDTKTYAQTMQDIKTERDLEIWYQDFTVNKITFPLLEILKKNIDSIIKTVGPMQVSIEFSRAHAKTKKMDIKNIREYVYTREGGVYFGSAYLLDYRHDYPEYIYLFADYNAGRYASRNAGFQTMLADLSGFPLQRDGDLIQYNKGATETSKSYFSVLHILKNYGEFFDEKTILKDLEKEKTYEFNQTYTYKTIRKIYKNKYGKTIDQAIPEITLKSEKFTRKLTTSWFANRVKEQFQNCLSTKIH